MTSFQCPAVTWVTVFAEQLDGDVSGVPADRVALGGHFIAPSAAAAGDADTGAMPPSAQSMSAVPAVPSGSTVPAEVGVPAVVVRAVCADDSVPVGCIAVHDLVRVSVPVAGGSGSWHRNRLRVLSNVRVRRQPQESVCADVVPPRVVARQVLWRAPRQGTSPGPPAVGGDGDVVTADGVLPRDCRHLVVSADAIQGGLRQWLQAHDRTPVYSGMVIPVTVAVVSVSSASPLVVVAPPWESMDHAMCRNAKVQ